MMCVRGVHSMRRRKKKGLCCWRAKVFRGTNYSLIPSFSQESANKNLLFLQLERRDAVSLRDDGRDDGGDVSKRKK